MLSSLNPNDPEGLLIPDGMRRGYNLMPAASTMPTSAPSAPSSPTQDAAQKHELTGPERLEQFGSALQDFANGFAGLERRPQDAAALEAMQRQLQQQQETFAQQVKFGQMPGPYRPVASTPINAPGVAAARPGDRAIGALASLYR